MEIVHAWDHSERSAVIKDAMHSADIIHMFDIFCCVGFDFLFGENWRKASTVLHLRFLPSKRKKARKYELFEVCIYFIAQVCATGTKKMTLNSPDFAAYEISFKIT